MSMQDKDEAERLKKLRERNRMIIEHSGNFSPVDIIASGKAKKYSSKREIIGVIAAVCAAVFLVAGIAVAAGIIFRVGSVQVTNEEDFFAEDIIAASKIRYGQNLILADKQQISDNIAAAIPYAANISVKKVFPSKIKISLSKAAGKYYIKAGREYYILDDECTVIAKTDKIEDIELAGYTRLQSREISRCVVGKKLLYFDEDLYGVFDELEKLLVEYGYSGFCSEIFLDSKFDIKFTYMGRYTVKLGDLRDLEIKFQFLEKITDTLPGNAGGTIDVSDKDLHEAIVTLYE